MKNDEIRISTPYLCLNEWTSLKFIWHMAIRKVQFSFEKGGFALLFAEVMAPDRLYRSENGKHLVSAV